MTDQTAIDQAKDIGALQADVANLKESVAEINTKLDQLVAAANMGKGVWWASVKVGGILVTCAAGLSWVWQNILHLPGR